MLTPTQVFHFSSGSLWWIFAFFAFVAAYEPVLTYHRHRENIAVQRRCLTRLFLRLILIALLIPPFTWAVTEGRWGATIRLRERELAGFSLFGQFLGKVDLDGVSLRLEHRSHNRGTAWVLVGAKKREELRIDGYVDQFGRSLLDVVRTNFGIPIVEVR